MLYYTIGEVAKLTDLSKKALMYYEDAGVLTPSMVGDNGYRYYTEEDIKTINKISVLKYFGIPIKDMKDILDRDEKGFFLELLDQQVEGFQNTISNLQNIIKIIEAISENMKNNSDFNWNDIVRLVKILHVNNDINVQYNNANNLLARIRLHQLYSISKMNWYRWLYEIYDLPSAATIVELGCGNGEIWSRNRERLDQSFKLNLTDISGGMLSDAKKSLEGIVKANYEIVDCCDLPYDDESVDIVIANHVLFYATDIDVSIKEISRVLKKDGILYCSTYGKEHMKTISDIVKKFDSRIYLSNINLYEVFGLDNGEEILGKYFPSVHKQIQEDGLNITNVEPLYDYIISCHGNQKELLHNKEKQFKWYLENILDTQSGVIYVKKQAGTFICKKE